MKVKNKIIFLNVFIMILITLIIMGIIYAILADNYDNFSKSYLDSINKSYVSSIDKYIQDIKALSKNIEITTESELFKLVDDKIINSMISKINIDSTINDKEEKINTINNLKDNNDIYSMKIIDLYYIVGFIDYETTDKLNSTYRDISSSNSDFITNINLLNNEGIAIASNNSSYEKVDFSFRNYYKEVILNKEIFIEPFIIDIISKEKMIAISLPIIVNRKVISILVLQFRISNFLNQIFSQANILYDGYIQVLTLDKNVIYNDASKDKNSLNDEKYTLYLSNYWRYKYGGILEHRYKEKNIYTIIDFAHEIDWILVINIDKNKLYSNFYFILILITLIFFLSFLFKIIHDLYSTDKIIKSINNILKISTRLENNDFNFEYEKIEKEKDSIDSLINSLLNIKYNMALIVNFIKNFYYDLNINSNNLVELSTFLSNDLDIRIESIDQIINSVADIYGNMEYNLKNIDNLEQKISENNSFVKEISESINIIFDLINQIIDVVENLKKLSSDTNSLALNATIEASRAGTYGKSFSIVANEVGKLADSSNESAFDILKLSKNVFETIDETKEVVDRVIPNIGINFTSVKKINNSLKEQLYTTRQIKNSIELLNDNLKGSVSSNSKFLLTIKELQKNTNLFKDTLDSFNLK